LPSFFVVPALKRRPILRAPLRGAVQSVAAILLELFLATDTAQ
jgi:hypothetical protein